MNTISRREFLRISALVAGSMMLQGGLSACVSGAAVGSGSVAGGVAAGTAARTIARYFMQFAIATASRIVSQEFMEWFQGLSEDDQQYVRAKTDPMTAAGFTIYSTPVYLSSVALAYCAENEDRRNACAPFFSANGVFLVEGPSLMGLSLAAQGWQSGVVGPGDGLIPTGAYQPPGAMLEASFEKPFKYDTAAGTVEINYEREANQNKGLVSVVAQRDNGGLLHGADYAIAWT